MKKTVMVVLFVSTFLTLSCSSDNDSTNSTTDLEGEWRLLNNPAAAKLTFEGQNWKLNSGTVEMSGTFTLVDNLMSGQVDFRSGQGSDLIQPNTFSGNAEIENNKVTFTNFSGNWFAPFSGIYYKQ